MGTFSNQHEQKIKTSDVIEHDTDKTGKADWIMSQETPQNGRLRLDFPWTKARLCDDHGSKKWHCISLSCRRQNKLSIWLEEITNQGRTDKWNMVKAEPRSKLEPSQMKEIYISICALFKGDKLTLYCHQNNEDTSRSRSFCYIWFFCLFHNKPEKE